MKASHPVRSLMIPIAALCVLTAAVPAAQADIHHPRRPRAVRHHPYHGHVVSWPELIAKVILHAGHEYYYHHGYFYQKFPRGYVVVNAPIGVVVDALPLGYKTVIINGRTYYYFNDTYYQRHAGHYMVVPDPVFEVVPLPAQATVVRTFSGPETLRVSDGDRYTVNIPGANGTYVAVVITAKEGGYIGPQGEFYEEFPSVKQLQVMYGK